MKKTGILLVIAAALLSGCLSKNSMVSQSSNTNAAPMSNKPAYTTAPAAQRDVTTAEKLSEPSGGGGGGRRNEEIVKQQVSLNQAENVQNQPVAIERKIVRNADLQLESEKPDEAQQKITAIAESKGGFVVESQQSTSDQRSATRDTVTMTVRVPAEKFGEALGEIYKTVSRVVVETVKSDDVTEEFIDIEAQLKAKKSLEAQFLEIMKRANTVEDALDVQRQLAEVRGEIEKIEGRKRFLENQAALSTIKIRIQKPATFTENSNGFGDRLKDSFGSGFDAALSFVLGLLSFVIAILPFLILIVLPIYLVVRYILKKRSKERTAREIAQEELKVE
jgi:hypothetical protein